jgi:serine/threonine-protein kinase RsbT
MIEPHLEVTIESEEHILKARTKVRMFISKHLKFSLLERMHALTAVSELTRNIYKYAGSGKMKASILDSSNGKRGVKIIFEDEGPGIEDIEEAMKPKPIFKYQTGMGLGLSGSRKLADEFDVKSEVGKGTVITWIRWER